jgi:hypothetical protein
MTLSKIVPIFAVRECCVVSATGPLPSVVNLGFLDLSPYYLYQVAPHPHEAEWTPFQTHCYLENLVGHESNPRPLDLQLATLTTIPQRRSYLH